MNSVFDFCLIEIDQQADSVFCNFQICQQLSKVDRKNNFDGLELDHHLVVDQEVDPKATIELKFLVQQGYLNLSFDIKPTIGQLVLQALLVDAFKQAGSQGVVNLKRGIDDNAGCLVDRVRYWDSLCFSLCLCVSVVHVVVSASTSGIRL